MESPTAPAMCRPDKATTIGVGCSDAQTVSTGPALAGSDITTAGSFAVFEEISGSELGTITVE